jgi:hypothetical protein
MQAPPRNTEQPPPSLISYHRAACFAAAVNYLATRMLAPSANLTLIWKVMMIRRAFWMLQHSALMSAGNGGAFKPSRRSCYPRSTPEVALHSTAKSSWTGSLVPSWILTCMTIGRQRTNRRHERQPWTDHVWRTSANEQTRGMKPRYDREGENEDGRMTRLTAVDPMRGGLPASTGSTGGGQDGEGPISPPPERKSATAPSTAAAESHLTLHNVDHLGVLD